MPVSFNPNLCGRSRVTVPSSMYGIIILSARSWGLRVGDLPVLIITPEASRASDVKDLFNGSSVFSRYSPPLKNRNLAIVSSVNPLFSFSSLRWASVSLPWAQIDSYMDCIYESICAQGRNRFIYGLHL